jgi:hypothetical protein
MAYGSEGVNVRFKHKLILFLGSLRCIYIGLMLLDFKDHLKSFKKNTHSFLNHSKQITNERDIWFERV